MIPLAALGIFAAFQIRNRKIVLLLGWLGFFFVCWWFLTHRIDRFWLPAVPIFCAIAGFGPTLFHNRIGRSTLIRLLSLSCIYGFLLAGIPAPGKVNRVLAPLDTLRRDPAMVPPWTAWLNARPESGKILLVGDAKAFLYDKNVLYNTCWNNSPLEEIFRSENPLEEFRRRDIDFVLVDWAEIARFRSPGNYGYTNFIQPAIFERLVADGTLVPIPAPETVGATSTIVYRVAATKS